MAQRGAVLVMILGGALALSGCSRIASLNPFGSRTTSDVPYAASLSDDRAGNLTVTVKAAGAGLDAVRESARMPVTEYCLRQHGSSAADWVMDGAGADWAATRNERGDLTFRARCRA
ncbi:hypothetical protein [Falsigemmobacter faecalis]|uniref:Uncharacterized protein n=1 Tax=Falsigemmobacter faecalis TaxID=2488730 RepID=A0A3P3DR30_9RHOB|nr:hypothetical protein [Falsigemmobacter faecalis]RRH76394.1 hypothetical protein EG244_06465 [Falsigemmobacter faecalis]